VFLRSSFTTPFCETCTRNGGPLRSRSLNRPSTKEFYHWVPGFTPEGSGAASIRTLLVDRRLVAAANFHGGRCLVLCPDYGSNHRRSRSITPRGWPSTMLCSERATGQPARSPGCGQPHAGTYSRHGRHEGSGTLGCRAPRRRPASVLAARSRLRTEPQDSRADTRDRRGAPKRTGRRFRCRGNPPRHRVMSAWRPVLRRRPACPRY
jgi:hypothetical protein